MINLDKYIKMNISYVSKDFGIMAILLICVFLCFIFAQSIPTTAILLALILGLLINLIKVYKKLFYQGLFGERALMEGTLPLTERETVVAKVFVATCGRIIFEASVPAMLSSIWVLGQADMGISKDILLFLIPEGVEPSQLPATIALLVFTAFIRCFCQSAMIFAAVVWYNTLAKGDRTLWAKLAAAIALVAMSVVLTQVQNLLGNINMMIGEAAMAVMALTLGLILCRMSEKRLQSRYCI